MIEPIVRHISDVLTSGNQTHTNWILDYLANIVQRPHKKTQIAILLYGMQGVGKGIIFEFFRKYVLGEKITFNTSNPGRDLFDKFGNGFVNKIFVQVDELKDMQKYSDDIKDIITRPKVCYQGKGKDGSVVDDFTNLVFTTNNARTLPLTCDNRRFVFFQCTNAHRGDKKYFNELGAHLDNPEVARGFYEHLMSRDLSAYVNDFQGAGRPITAYFNEVRRDGIPLLSCFMSKMVVDINFDIIKTNVFTPEALYERYVIYYDNNHTKYQEKLPQRNFWMEVAKLPGVTKDRKKTGKVYVFDTAVIMKDLTDKNHFDADVEDLA